LIRAAQIGTARQQRKLQIGKSALAPAQRDRNMIPYRPEFRCLSQNGCSIGAFLFLKISKSWNGKTFRKSSAAAG
jgi:hypothetical protein